MKTQVGGKKVSLTQSQLLVTLCSLQELSEIATNMDTHTHLPHPQCN